MLNRSAQHLFHILSKIDKDILNKRCIKIISSEDFKERIENSMNEVRNVWRIYVILSQW